MARKEYIASDLRERVDLESFTEVNTEGHITKSWTADEEDIPAMVREETGRERVANGRLEATGGVIVLVRARSDLTYNATKRFDWRGEILQITAPLRYVDKRRRFIELTCTRTDADG